MFQTVTWLLQRLVTWPPYTECVLHIPWSRVLLEKLIGFQLVKKFPEFYWTRKFITAFTSAHHLSLSWASSIQSTLPHPNSWRSILILSSHLRLGLPSRLFPSGFPTKTLYTPLLSPIRAICPGQLILLDFITRKILGEEYRSLSSSLCSFLHSPVTLSFLVQNILLHIQNACYRKYYKRPAWNRSSYKIILPTSITLSSYTLLLSASTQHPGFTLCSWMFYVSVFSMFINKFHSLLNTIMFSE